MEKRTLRGQAEFRADEIDGQKHIAGYFIVFDDTYQLPDGSVEQIDRHAVDSAIGQDIRCLTDHDTRLVLGRTLAGTMTMRIDDHGVYADIIINPDDTDALNTWARVKRRDVSQASFGFDPIRQSRSILPDGRTRYLVEELTLYELTVCTFPAYESTELFARSREQTPTPSPAQLWREQQTRRLKNHA